MASINPHINFNGNCEEAFGFYKSAFGGEFARIIRFRDFPALEPIITANEADNIMQIALPVGSAMLLGNDIPEAMGRVNERENRSKIAVAATSFEEAGRLFSELSEGGEVEVVDGENPSGAYFAMFRDKYGIEWTVDFNPEAPHS